MEDLVSRPLKTQKFLIGLMLVDLARISWHPVSRANKKHFQILLRAKTALFKAENMSIFKKRKVFNRQYLA